MNLAVYVGLLHSAEGTLASSLRAVAEGHAAEVDVFHLCHQLAGQCDQHDKVLAPVAERYGEQRQAEPERLRAEGLAEVRSGPLGLLRDLHDLYTLAAFVDISWTMVGQAARGERDHELLGVVSACEQETRTQMAWLRTRLKQAAPQALLVAE